MHLLQCHECVRLRSCDHFQLASVYFVLSLQLPCSWHLTLEVNQRATNGTSLCKAPLVDFLTHTEKTSLVAFTSRHTNNASVDAASVLTFLPYWQFIALIMYRALSHLSLTEVDLRLASLFPLQDPWKQLL